jgi:hypothetical protein
MVARRSSWDGVERRSGEDRRHGDDRRAKSRDVWERRSGLDRRGHKLYATLIELRAELETAELEIMEPERLSDTG